MVGEPYRRIVWVSLFFLLIISILIFIIHRNDLVFIFELFSLCVISYLILRSPIRYSPLDKRAESSRLLIVGGLCSLLVFGFASIPYWADSGSMEMDAGIILFVLLGSLTGASFPLVRRFLPVSAITSSMILSLMFIFPVFVIIKNLLYEANIAQGPGFVTGSVLWLTYGLLLGLGSRLLGFDKHQPPGKKRCISRFVPFGLILIVMFAWFSPIPYFRPAKIHGLEEVIPTGFQQESFARFNYLRLAESDFYTDFRFARRKDDYHCLSYYFRKTDTKLQVSVTKGSEKNIESVFNNWKRHMENYFESWYNYKELLENIKYVVFVDDPSFGIRSIAWETQIGDTTTQMMIFTTERYRVVIFTRCPSTSSKVEWDEIWAIGEKIEDNIK